VSTSPAQSGPPALDDERLGRLLEAAEELAKRWLLMLLDERPLGAAAELPLERFAADAPRVCERVLRALGSDAELERLRERRADPDGDDRGVAAIVGVSDGPGLVEAIEALRTAMWGAIAETLPDAASPALANRLAQVCSALAAAALAQLEEARAAASEEGTQPGDAASATGEDRGPRIEMQEEGREEGEETIEDPWAIEPPTEEDEPPWPNGVASEIKSHPDPDVPFVVLVVEVADLERLREAEESPALERMMSDVERVLREPLGADERLAPEGTGRWWLVAFDAGPPEGRALAQQLARAVRAAVEHRHAPLKVAIGIASSPEDGTDAAELAERAEEELYAARASGVCVLPAAAAGAPAPGGTET